MVGGLLLAAIEFLVISRDTLGALSLGGHKLDPLNPTLTKLGGQIKDSQPKIPCEFGASSMLVDSSTGSQT